MELDYNQIFDGVSLALHAAFPTKNIFGGTVYQGLQKDSLNVVPVNTAEESHIATRSFRSVTFDVIYYPPDVDGIEACLEMQHKLSQILETITTPNGDKIHGLHFRGTTDETLHFIVTYPHFVYRPAEQNAMEHLTVL